MKETNLNCKWNGVHHNSYSPDCAYHCYSKPKAKKKKDKTKVHSEAIWIAGEDCFECSCFTEKQNNAQEKQVKDRINIQLPPAGVRVLAYYQNRPIIAVYFPAFHVREDDPNWTTTEWDYELDFDCDDEDNLYFPEGWYAINVFDGNFVLEPVEDITGWIEI